jgi:hypothetical protein
VYINQPYFLCHPHDQWNLQFMTGNMADLSKSSSKSLPLDEKSQTLDNIRATEEAVNVATANADDALKYAATETVLLDEATKSRLLRTTDRHVLPWLCALYFMQSIDKGVRKFSHFRNSAQFFKKHELSLEQYLIRRSWASLKMLT